MGKKIAIIGGGFYGTHLALKISNIADIDLYEKNNSLMSEAIMNNQHRLHLGYHYPKCNDTIKQCIRSYEKFMNEYFDSVKSIKNNLYIIHKDSHINFKEYIDTFKSHNLQFKRIKIDEIEFLNNKNQYIGALQTDEKMINLSVLYKILIKKINENNKKINVITNTKVINVSENSEVITEKYTKKYDYVINCTYSNPNIGLVKNKFNTKSELCFLTLLKFNNNTFKDKSITIMDGNHISIYPTDNDNIYTLSSVKYTPYFKGSIDDLNNIKKNNINYDIINKTIIEHSKNYVNYVNYEIVGNYTAIKTKILDDKNFFRSSFYVRENNNISIMCGKISAILDIQDNIINELNI
jgi:hypothetical protein